MLKNEFIEKINRCLDEACLETRYFVSDDPDEEASIFVSDEGALYFFDIKSPFTIQDIKKIKYSKYDAKYERVSEVNLYFENCVITFGETDEFENRIEMYLYSEKILLEYDALMAYFDALNNNEVYLIDNGVFYGCIEKKPIIEIPENVVYIEKTRFLYKEMIRKIVFSKSVEEICDYCFRFMDNLEEVILNEGLKKIGKEAFYQCPKLKKIVIPSTVTKIELSAFKESGLEEVEILSDKIEYEAGVFKGTPYYDKNKNC